MTRTPMKTYRTCRWCHCREDRACMIPDGEGGFEPCHWVGPRTCSAPRCVAQARDAIRQGEKGVITSVRRQQAMRHTTKDGREICRSSYAWLLRRREVWLRDGGLCQKCATAVELRDAQIHHRVPRGMGGGRRDDSPANLETLCLGCHGAQHHQAIGDGGVLAWLACQEGRVA